VFRNNYIYLSDQNDPGGDITLSFNHFQNAGATQGTNATSGSGNPFVDYTNGNFRLASATTAGTTLASPYNTDMFGNTRGADGTWDRGALEFCSGGCADPNLSAGGSSATAHRFRFVRLP
jgi:hypothetical protein